MFILKKRKEKKKRELVPCPLQPRDCDPRSLPYCQLRTWRNEFALYWSCLGLVLASVQSAPGAEALMGGEVVRAHWNLMVSSCLSESFVRVKLTLTQTSLKLWTGYALHGACFDHDYSWLVLWRWNHLVKINLHWDVLKNWHLSCLFC